MSSDIDKEDDIPVEDIPLYEVSQKVVNNFSLDTNNTTKTKTVTKEVFNTVKGHHLLGWCVALLAAVYLIEFIWDNGKLSAVGSDFIEIIKLLIFSLTGYLFGTHSHEKDNE